MSSLKLAPMVEPPPGMRSSGGWPGASATHDQLHTLYQRQGTELGPKELWNKIGATPMVGQNDVAGEVFTRRTCMRRRGAN
jgi:hypothetical protein